MRAARNVLLNVTAVCVLLLAIEFGGRILLHDHGGEANSMLLDRWAAFRMSENFDRPGVHHNAQGFRRDTNLPIAKGVNTVRIFLLGASVTYGAEGVYLDVDDRWNPTNHETIDYFLEQRLNAAFPSKRWEVINAGVKGYLVHQDLMRLVSTVLAYKPDCVISIDGVNDLMQYARVGRHWDPFAATARWYDFNELTHPQSFSALPPMLSAWLASNSVVFRTMADRAARRAILEEFRSRARRNGVVPREIDPARFTPEEQEQVRNALAKLPLYRRSLRQMHRILEIDGVEDFFALQPLLQLSRKSLVDREARLAEYDRSVAGPTETYVYTTFYPLLAKELAADSISEGYGFVDLTGVFDGVKEQTFSDYCHLTPAGNRIVADRLLEVLRGSETVRRLYPAVTGGAFNTSKPPQ